MTTTAPPQSPLIETDVPCRGCRYNLRTLSITGICPECGHSNEHSWQSFQIDQEELGKLRENGLPWIRAMRAAVTLALLAWIFSVGGAAFGLSPLRQSSGADTVGRAIFHLFVYALGAASTWKLMAFRQRSTVLRLGRVSILAALAALIAAYASVLHFASAGPAPALRYLAVFWPFLITASFGRLTQLAWMCEQRWQSVVLGLIGLCAAVMAALVAGSVFEPYPSDYVRALPLLPGPTAAWPMLWTAVAQAIADRAGLVNLIITGPFLLVYCVLGMMLNRLRLRLSRAIQLSESRAASSPTSPSPHLPA